MGVGIVLAVAALASLPGGAWAGPTDLWTMSYTLCNLDGYGTYRLHVEGRTAYVEGEATCDQYTHHTQHAVPLTPLPRREGYAFEHPLFALRLDADFRLVELREHNDLLGGWVVFRPMPTRAGALT